MYPLATASKTSHAIDTVIKENNIAVNLTNVLAEKTRHKAGTLAVSLWTVMTSSTVCWQEYHSQPLSRED